MIATLAVGTALAQSPLQGEVELKAASRVERDAGVWLDGQYVGFVGYLHGRGRLVVVPGPHELVFRLIGYRELRRAIVVQPDTSEEQVVSLEPDSGVTYPKKEETARVRIDVAPTNAAIFVNEQFVGHVDRFNGRRGMRLSPGTYRFTVALPGYKSLQTEMTLRKNQTYEIETDLPKGPLSEQAAELLAANAGVLDLAD